VPGQTDHDREAGGAPADRTRAEDALARSESALAQAGTMAHLGAWWLDLENADDINANPLHWSDEVYRIFGYEPGAVDVSNELFFAHVHPDDRRRVSDTVAEALAQDRPYVTEHRIVRRDGTERIVLEHGELQRDGAGRRLRIVGAVQDVTDRKRAEDALRAANDELAEANRQKNEFLAMLSHELRNPLAPILNSVHVLEHAGATGEQGARARSVIRRQLEHLTRLVDDLLDVTRIARGKIELRRTQVDLREVVWRAADDFRLVMSDRGIAFRTAVPDGTLWADADATRITQAIGNLLHNASKYARRGEEVALTLRAIDGCAEISVRDTGAGIDAALLPRVFEPFVQGQRTIARTEGGLGLGLALVKGIAEMHGGTVRVESAGRDRGAEFVLRIPALAAAAPRRAPEPDAAPGEGGRRVLVVDDNVDAAESLADVVRMLGHDVEVAYDGPTALARARAAPPDVVLCDIGLPGMSGYDVARALRADGPRGGHLVAVTGYALPEDVARALAAGFDAHVPKPVDPEEIRRLIVDRGRASAAASPSPTSGS
jgi:PAS domain S-box-containing protein